uniref:Uncharacterized protein n=1 Tax=Rhizophora mucronata TaxID=61149 RepID=A0A2P2MLS9_RHIMU
MRSRDQANSHPLILAFECWEKSLSSLARLGATCLLTEVISEKKKQLFEKNSLCLLMSQGLEEELPDSMLELRSFLTLPMKPEIRVGIGVFPLPFLLAFRGWLLNQ